MPLTAKQQRFVEEYLIDLNATQAAIRAGYSEKTARQVAAENLAKPNIAAEVDRLLAERSRQTGIDAAWLLKRLADEAEADIADIYTEHGTLKPVREWPMIWRKGLVQGTKVDELFEGRGDDREMIGLVKEVKLSDRIKRLELIGKHIGVKAFEETVRVKGLEGLGERLSRAAHRLKSEESNR